MGVVDHKWTTVENLNPANKKILASSPLNLRPKYANCKFLATTG